MPRERSWYYEREEGNAESIMLDDIPIQTRELIECERRDQADERLSPAPWTERG